MQEIPAVKFGEIFEMEAKLRWALLIRAVRGGRNLLRRHCFDGGFHPGQGLTSRVCSDISSTLSEAGAALIETQHQGMVGIGLGFKKMFGYEDETLLHTATSHRFSGRLVFFCLSTIIPGTSTPRSEHFLPGHTSSKMCFSHSQPLSS